MLLLLYFDGLLYYIYIYTPTTLLLNTNTVKTILPKLTTFGFMATLMGCVDDLIHWFFVFLYIYYIRWPNFDHRILLIYLSYP